MTRSRTLPVVVDELAVADDVNDDDDAEHDADVGYFAEEPFWDKFIFKLMEIHVRIKTLFLRHKFLSGYLYSKELKVRFSELNFD